MKQRQAPPVRPFGHLYLPPEHVEVLSNGITLHTVRGGDSPIITLSVFFPGGSVEYGRYASALTFNLLSYGAKGYEGKRLAEELDFNGIRLTTEISAHHSMVKAMVLSHRFDEAMPLLRAMITAPELPAGRLEVDKVALKASLETALANNSTVANDLFSPLVAGEGHPLALPTAPAEVELVARDTVCDIHRRALATAGMHIYASGLVDDAALAKIRDTFGSIPSDAHPEPEKIFPSHRNLRRR